MIENDSIQKERNQRWIKTIQEFNCFEAGHFHLEKNKDQRVLFDDCQCRTLGWMNTNSLLQSFRYLQVISYDFLNILNDNDNEFRADLVIGLGLEGNILGGVISTSSFLSNADYSYFPLSSNEESYFEDRILLARHTLNYKNRLFSHGTRHVRSNYRNVLILTNVIHDGKMVKNCIEKLLKDLDFSSIERFFILSIFNVHRDINNDTDFDPSKIFSKFENEIGKDIIFKYLCYFPIPPCPCKSPQDCALFLNSVVTIKRY